MAKSEGTRRPVRWQGRGARPREQRVTRGAIVDAAFRVMERTGSNAVTMRAVATEAGVAPQAVYWHVGNRDALVQAMADHLLAALTTEVDESQPWRRRVENLLHRIRERLVEVPVLSLLGTEQLATVLRGLRDVVRAALRDGGASDQQQEVLGRWLLFHLIGTVQNEVHWDEYRRNRPEATNLPRSEADAFFAYTTSLVLDAVERELAPLQPDG